MHRPASLLSSVRTALVFAALVASRGDARAQAAASTAPRAQDEVPCTALRSQLHGVVLLGARLESVGGPPCGVMTEYRDWMERSDGLLAGGRPREARFSGREWDFAAGAMRLGAPDWFVLIRGDSLSYAPLGRPRRLHLTAFAAEPAQAPAKLGSWYVLVDEDSAAMRQFRTALSARRLHSVVDDRGSLVYATAGVQVDGARVRTQLAEARALRTALGFSDPLPLARYIVGPARDTTLAILGVLEMQRPLFAMMVNPPLAVFAPLSAERALDRHEIVHVATFGRRDVVPGSVGEAFAMHHGGSHGRPFGESFCANKTIRGLSALSAAQLDSAFAGRWWDDARADVAGYALGHAIGWFIAQRSDSAWIFADGDAARDNDAIGFLAARSGIARADAMARITETFDQRRRACPSVPGPTAAAAPSRATPPSGAAAAPARARP